MGTVTFVEFDGTEHQAALEEGKSLMEIAMDNMVPGIDADCGGECACGTCHVIVADADFVRAGPIAGEEQQMLDMTPEKASTSRLSCQIKAQAEMDGLVLHLPEFQM